MSVGLNFRQVDIVINFDVASLADTSSGETKISGDLMWYSIRVGKTGRFGTEGLAITFYSA